MLFQGEKIERQTVPEQVHLIIEAVGKKEHIKSALISKLPELIVDPVIVTKTVDAKIPKIEATRIQSLKLPKPTPYHIRYFLMPAACHERLPFDVPGQLCVLVAVRQLPFLDPAEGAGELLEAGLGLVGC